MKRSERASKFYNRRIWRCNWLKKQSQGLLPRRPSRTQRSDTLHFDLLSVFCGASKGFALVDLAAALSIRALGTASLPNLVSVLAANAGCATLQSSATTSKAAPHTRVVHTRRTGIVLMLILN